MKRLNLKNNAAVKSVRDFMGELDSRSRYLLFSAVFTLISLSVIFIFLLPSVSALRGMSNTVNIEKANLDYVARYAKRIDGLKASNLTARTGQAGAAPKNKKTGYIKSVYAMLDYFKIKKDAVKKLTGSYLKSKAGYNSDETGGVSGKNKVKGKGQNEITGGKNSGRAEDVSLALRGLTLNELIDVIYGLSSSDYRVNFTSIKMHKNFSDNKLLNLNLSLERKITDENSAGTGKNKNVKNNKNNKKQ